MTLCRESNLADIVIKGKNTLFIFVLHKLSVFYKQPPANTRVILLKMEVVTNSMKS